MKYLNRFLLSTVLLLSVLVQVQADPIEFVELPRDYNAMLSVGVTNDGEKVVSNPYASGHCYKWTESTGFVRLGRELSVIWDVADNGRVAGYSYFWVNGDSTNTEVSMSYYDDPSNTWIRLGSAYSHFVDGTESTGFGMNDAGTYVTGYSWKPTGGVEACFWSEETGIQPLNQVFNGYNSRADGVSGDGSIIMGWSENVQGCRMGYRWVRNEDSTYSVQPLGTLCTDPTWPHAEPMDISENGLYIVGCTAIDGWGGSHGFLWSEENGMQNVSDGLEGIHSAIATAVTEDASIVVGQFEYYAGGLPTAFIWTELTGAMSLKEYLIENGADIPDDYTLMTAGDISQNGRYITGHALDLTLDEIFTYVVRINILAPENLVASVSEPDTLHMSWDYEPVRDDDELLLEYRYRPIGDEWGDYQFEGDMIPGTQSSAYRIIEFDGSYQFRMASIVDGETSYYVESNIVQTYGIPTSPQNFTSQVFWDEGYVWLEWDDVDEEGRYRLEFREQDANGNWLDWDLIAELERDVVEYSDYEVESDRTYGYRLRAENDLGNSEWVEVEVTVLSANEELSDLPTKTEITGTYPNPFNGTTNVSYNLHKPNFVAFQLFSIDGRLVETILSESKQAGSFTQVIDLQHQATGTYFLKMQTTETTNYRKLILVK